MWPRFLFFFPFPSPLGRIPCSRRALCVHKPTGTLPITLSPNSPVPIFHDPDGTKDLCTWALAHEAVQRVHFGCAAFCLPSPCFSVPSRGARRKGWLPEGGRASRLAAGRRGCHRAKNGPVSHLQQPPGALEGERAGGGRRGSPGGAGSSPPCRRGAARYRRFLAPRSPRLQGRGPECCGMGSHHRRAELPTPAGVTRHGEVLSLRVGCLGQQRTALASRFY